MNDTYKKVEIIFYGNNLSFQSIEEYQDNLVITVSDIMVLTLFQGKTVLDLYINEAYFGDISNQNLEPFFTSIMNNGFVFVFYRKPKGIRKIVYSTETKDWYERNKSKLQKERGIKVMTMNEVLIDTY